MNLFRQCYNYSIDRQEEDKKIIQNFFTHEHQKCIGVEKTEIQQDREGIDYIATMENGSVVYIDAKTRTPGCSKYWKSGEPELCIETWSDFTNRKIGWTFKESNVDYILYTFSQDDTEKFYMIPFQLLKKASSQNLEDWRNTYQTKIQKNVGYYSEAIFVPATIVLIAVAEQMAGGAAG